MGRVGFAQHGTSWGDVNKFKMIHCKYDELVDPKTLKDHPKNRNKHKKEQIDRLAELYAYHGVRHPIIVSKTSGYIVAGHGRKAAAIKAKIKEYPVVYQEFENQDKEYAFIQADNAIALWAELDLGGINTDILDLGPDFDINMLGIKDFVIEPAEKLGLVDEDEVPEQVESKTKLGDIYQLGEHRLMCGDSTSIDAVEKLMNGHKADMVFTDPPYGVSYEKKTREIANQSKTRLKSTIAGDDIGVDGLKEIISQAFVNINLVLADKSSYYICSPQGGEPGLMMMMMMQDAGIPCRHMIIWVKNAPVFSMGRLDYDYRHEPILYGWSPKRTHHKIMAGEHKNSVWEIKREPNKLHPTMKPVEIPVNAISNSCPSGGNVLDLFGGSGSTLIACEKTNRKCFMMELDPYYCDVIVARWEKYTGKKGVLLNGNQTAI